MTTVKWNACFRYSNKFFHSNKILLFLFILLSQLCFMLSTYAFDANKLTMFHYSLFVLHLFSWFSSFIIRDCIPEFFIYYFHFSSFFRFNNSFVLLFTWWTRYFTSFCWILHSLHWLEAFIWSSSQMNDPSLQLSPSCLLFVGNIEEQSYRKHSKKYQSIFHKWGHPLGLWLDICSHSTHRIY